MATGCNFMGLVLLQIAGTGDGGNEGFAQRQHLVAFGFGSGAFGASGLPFGFQHGDFGPRQTDGFLLPDQFATKLGDLAVLRVERIGRVVVQLTVGEMHATGRA